MSSCNDQCAHICREQKKCLVNLTSFTGNVPRISLNSSLTLSLYSLLNINSDKWWSLMCSGISVNFDKSRRISVLDFFEISIGVSLFSLQAAVGSTLRNKCNFGRSKQFDFVFKAINLCQIRMPVENFL